VIRRQHTRNHDAYADILNDREDLSINLENKVPEKKNVILWTKNSSKCKSILTHDTTITRPQTHD